jgi:beta-glucosidase
MQLLNNGGDLINYVADHHNDTIVYVEAPGPVDMEPWASHPNVTAIMYGYFGGQEMGHAIANVAFGDVNPSGKLPFTLAKEVSDYPLNLYNGSVAINPVANFTEGEFIDYKVSQVTLAPDLEQLFAFSAVL